GSTVRLSDDELVLEFSTQAKPLAVFARQCFDELEASCREVFGSSIRLTIEVEGGVAPGQEDENPLMREALADPGVILVQKVLGGEVISAVPDGEPN
ncbi:MAG: hypothetical protein DRJ61_11245, partial [Acidobacteria bacterium]